jgi:hypothetical protein
MEINKKEEKKRKEKKEERNMAFRMVSVAMEFYIIRICSYPSITQQLPSSLLVSYTIDQKDEPEKVKKIN